MKTRSILPILAFFIALLPGRAQVSGFKATVPANNTEKDVFHLMESLIGQGIVLKNYSITRTSAPDAFGFFEDQRATLGMKKGLLMTSGGISHLTAANTGMGFSSRNSISQGKNKGTYPELSRLIQGELPTFDACVIELDIVPTSDTLSFNYVFGSDEYDEYVGSKYNDVFGFFISGKGIEGDRNLAVVPGTEIPVSINTINGGNDISSAESSNASYYVRNTDGSIAIEYDGLTRLMEIRQPVIPYETYHLKLAIADVSDDALDSGVFIEGQSLISFDKSYNVLFDVNSDIMDPGYKTMLNDLVKLYKSRPEEQKGRIILTGHTDADGTPEYNEKLSARRADEVYGYLKNQGINVDDMELVYKGENMPRSDNYNEEGRQLNRRVEIKLCGSLAKYQEAKTAELSNAREANAIRDNFPNPFSSSTTIRAFLNGEVKQASLLVSDLKGNLVKTIHVLDRGATETFFGAEDLPGGTYLATLYADGVSAGSLKLIVQR
jgi:outer membrane protein OmpA-like peptidoglycan-associated protein